MDGFLTPVKTTRNVKSNIQKFETLSLRDNEVKNEVKNDVAPTRKNISEASNRTANSTSALKEQEVREGLVDGNDHVQKEVNLRKPTHISTIPGVGLQPADGSVSSPEQALVILKEQPDEKRLEAVLRYLEDGIHKKHNFNIHVPSALAAQILKVLGTSIVSDRWAILDTKTAFQSERAIRKLLVLCMTSIPGIGVVLARTQSLVTSPQLRKPGSSHHAIFKDTTSFFTSMIYHKTIVRDLLNQSQSSGNRPGQQQALWAEATSLLAGSKILNVFLEASAIIELKGQIPSWLQDAKVYSRWLGVNIASAAIDIAPTHQDGWKMLASFLKRALSLGYRDTLVAELYSQLLLGDRALWTPLRSLSSCLPRLDQKVMLELILEDLAKKFLTTNSANEHNSRLVIDGRGAVGGVASIISGFIGDNGYLETQLQDWLTGASGTYTSQNLETRRAMILVLSTKEEKLRILLENSMRTFSDKLHIKHDTILQQEALSQVILITAGYLYRMKSNCISHLSRSSSYLQAVSNRLAASIPQARFLGMVVGVAISKLVDHPDKGMKFDAAEMESQEAEWWFNLTTIEDVTDNMEALKKLLTDGSRRDAQLIPQKRKPVQTLSPKTKPQTESSKVINIEEVDDQEDSGSEDGLIPYEKPDEDPADSDDDPTLINRSKPKKPVYITDLIKSLSVMDKPEVVELALQTAPSLIRRKASFGSELSENVVAVAGALINLQESMSNQELPELRVQGLIACLVSQPNRMGPWFTSMYFEGDFSLSQRASLLTTIGLSAREIAGHRDEGTPSASHTRLPPSKELPGHLAALYEPLSSLTNQIQQRTLRPMALAAADQASGPNILKIRTFSSRMEVEKRTKAVAQDRSRRIPKDLHRVLSESIYLPLCCRMTILLAGGGGGSSSSSSSSNNGMSLIKTHTTTSTLFEPQILKLFLQTLTVILTTIGPHAMQLPTLTRETLLLLTALRHRTPWANLSLDPAVLPSLLTLMLTTLEVNVEAGTVAEERLVTDFGDLIAELVRWVASLADDGNVRIPEVDREAVEMEMGMGTPWTLVAAGIQVKWHEVGKKFHTTMVGLVGGMDF